MSSGAMWGDEQWPRGYWRRWVPVVGPEYATIVTRDRAWSIALNVVGVCCVVSVLATVWFAGRTPLSTVVAYGLCAVPAVLAWRVVPRPRKTASRIVADLTDRGIAVTRGPSFKSLATFSAWCEEQHITAEQVRETGRLSRPAAAR
ncbi:MAG TPA: hypothetical protein VJR25_14800 [Microbacterium sp.]|uniref:hypothetical protein n=1 Tax=Microbacterium sp. TaxID=51671 RepID=UPI002B49F2AD|nr:hypothetical protein [Microbacterium sp.]HKT58029.1 hypothetical protein [Microbacterium sp.]